MRVKKKKGKPPKRAAAPKMRLEDLSNDCLMEVLERISPANLMKMARVNKRLNKLVEIKLPLKIKRVVVEKYETQNCRHQRLDRDEVVSFNKIFAKERSRKEAVNRHFAIKKSDNPPPAKVTFLKTLSRLPSVKSIDFGEHELTGEVLQEVAKFCPKIECLTVKKSVVIESVWHDLFSRLGHQIVHFNLIHEDNSIKEPSTLFKMIILMCPNIKQIFLKVDNLTASLIDLLGKLPKDSFVAIDVDEVDQSFNDNIDELASRTIHLSDFGKYNGRLKTLTFYYIENYDFVVGVEFASLKHLNVNCYGISPNLNCLAACRFPALELLYLFKMTNEEFDENTIMTEDLYGFLFKVMPKLKELRIGYYSKGKDDNLSSVLPGPAILQLKKIERIHLKIPFFCEAKLVKSIKKLNWYFNKISTLKRIIIQVNETILGDYNRLIELKCKKCKSFPYESDRDRWTRVQWIDELMKLKARNKRFEIDASSEFAL